MIRYCINDNCKTRVDHPINKELERQRAKAEKGAAVEKATEKKKAPSTKKTATAKKKTTTKKK